VSAEAGTSASVTSPLVESDPRLESTLDGLRASSTIRLGKSWQHNREQVHFAGLQAIEDSFRKTKRAPVATCKDA